MIYTYFEMSRYCATCRTKTVQYRHHRTYPKSFRMLYFWPVAAWRAACDPWRCRRCSRFTWW